MEIKEYDYGDEWWFGGEGHGQITVGDWVTGGDKKDPIKWSRLQKEAQMIAASHDLLKALEPFVLTNSSEEFVTLVVRSSDITKARAAIAKATGEQA